MWRGIAMQHAAAAGQTLAEGWDREDPEFDGRGDSPVPDFGLAWPRPAPASRCVRCMCVMW